MIEKWFKDKDIYDVVLVFVAVIVVIITGVAIAMYVRRYRRLETEYQFVSTEPVLEGGVSQYTEYSPQSLKNYTLYDAIEGLKRIEREYGKEIAKRVEQIYRFETAHFRSVQYRRTGSAGRLWTGSGNRWCVYVLETPAGNKIVSAGTPGARMFCYKVYDSVYEAMKELAERLKNKGITAGTMSWRGGSLPTQLEYVNKVSSIQTQIIV